mmetsp:Transcript_19751/g.32915  ORF Transcript_19751/g.32915 Transcript_19751/m.32915 type:complete len:217 (-) Transcript_19751:123-773(-)
MSSVLRGTQGRGFYLSCGRWWVFSGKLVDEAIEVGLDKKVSGLSLSSSGLDGDGSHAHFLLGRHNLCLGGASRELRDTGRKGIGPGLGDGVELLARASGHVEEGGGEAVDLADGEVRGEVEGREGGEGLGDAVGELLVAETVDLSQEECEVLEGVGGVLFAGDKDVALELLSVGGLVVGKEFGVEGVRDDDLSVFVVVGLLGRGDFQLPVLAALDL